jgi:ankyrin repeat protein
VGNFHQQQTQTQTQNICCKSSYQTPANYKGGSYGITPLMAFILSRKQHHSNVLTAVEKYIQSGADLNAQNNDGDTALHIACRHGQLEIAERLVKLNAELALFNNAGLIPLHVAVCANQLEIVRMMLNYCKTMSETYEQAQQQQQLQQGANQTSQLIASERFNIIDVKADCVVGDTALIMAIRNNSIEMVELLIQFKANVNAVDNEGLSALHYCAKV